MVTLQIRHYFLLFKNVTYTVPFQHKLGIIGHISHNINNISISLLMQQANADVVDIMTFMCPIMLNLC